jgi:membrane protein
MTFYDQGSTIRTLSNKQLPCPHIRSASIVEIRRSRILDSFMAASNLPYKLEPSRLVKGVTPGIRRLRTLWTFSGTSLRDLVTRVCKNIVNDDLTGRSAQLAYYFFLSLFPALIFSSALIGFVAGTQTHLRDHLLQTVATFLPPAAFTLVSNTFSEVIQASSPGKIALGAIFALWTATSGMSAAEDTLNGIYRMKETRPFWKSTLVAFILTVVVVVLALSALLAFFYGGPLVTILAGQIGLNASLTFIWKLAQWPIALFLLSLVFAVTYFWAPDIKHKKWRWMTPGSVVGIAGWFAASGAFRAYLHFFNRYSVTYGSLGAFIILLLWFYLSAFSLLLGAEVDATIEWTAIENCQLAAKPQAQEDGPQPHPRAG